MTPYRAAFSSIKVSGVIARIFCLSCLVFAVEKGDNMRLNMSRPYRSHTTVRLWSSTFDNFLCW